MISVPLRRLVPVAFISSLLLASTNGDERRRPRASPNRSLNVAPGIRSPARCENEISSGLICEAANSHALEFMREANLTGITLVQNVSTGELIAFAATNPETLDVSSSIQPLSVVKLMLAASWWDHEQPEAPVFEGVPRLSVHEMIVTGRDNAGRKMASALRKSIGTACVQQDLEKYGFPSCSRKPRPKSDRVFWGELDSTLQPRLIPAASYTDLCRELPDREWEDTLSIGEARFSVTALHISRFLQAVGNDGVMVTPVALSKPSKKHKLAEIRVMRAETARKLQAAMRDVVQRGTARSVSNFLAATGWDIGGKTGSAGAPIGPQSDGWFAGLVFDPSGKARFTVATYVRHGGPGGGNAAKISAELARYIILG